MRITLTKRYSRQKNRRSARMLVRASLLTMLSACASLSAPNRIRATFDAIQGVPNRAMPIPEVRVNADKIYVDGAFETPTQCYKLTGWANMSGSALIVHIAATVNVPPQTACPDHVVPWTYSIAITQIPGTAAAIRVVHAGSVGKNGVVLEQPIVRRSRPEGDAAREALAMSGAPLRTDPLSAPPVC